MSLTLRMISQIIVCCYLRVGISRYRLNVTCVDVSQAIVFFLLSLWLDLVVGSLTVIYNCSFLETVFYLKSYAQGLLI